MGQKTHPHGFRLGITKTWTSKWYEEKNFAKWLHEDIKLKKEIKKKLQHAGIASVDIEACQAGCGNRLQTAIISSGEPLLDFQHNALGEEAVEDRLPRERRPQCRAQQAQDFLPALA